MEEQGFAEGDKTVYHFSVAAIMKDEAANVR